MALRDLTVGSVKGHLAALALPLMLGNVLQQFYNTVDALVIGRFAGQAEFAAIGIAGSVMNLFLFAVVGATTGISVIFAQQYGAGRMAAFRRTHFLTLVSGLAVSLVGSLGAILLMPCLLALIQTPAELIPLVSEYLTVIFAALPGAFLYNLYSALLRAVGNTRTPLCILGAAVAMNLGLDILLVARYDLGTMGAAWATALAQGMSAVLCLAYLGKSMPGLLFRRSDWGMDADLLAKIFRFGFVTGLHQSGLYVGKMLVQGAVNTGGTALISAYTATTRIEGFANSFGDSGAAATSVVTAQNHGAGWEDRVRRTFRDSLLLLLLLGMVCSILMYASAGTAAAFLLGRAVGPAWESARQYLRIISIFYLFCFTGNAFAGFFDGVGKVHIPFIGAISHITLRVILSWLYVDRFGLNAVALATGIGWIGVNLFWMLQYLRRRGKVPDHP